MKKVGEWLIAMGVTTLVLVAVMVVYWLITAIATTFGPLTMIGTIVFIFVVAMVHDGMFGEDSGRAVRRVNVPPKKKKVDLDS